MKKNSIFNIHCHHWQFSNCKKEENYIPDVYVQTQILASEIGGIGQAIYIQGGLEELLFTMRVLITI